MKMMEDKIHYNRNINLGLILSLALTLIAFLILPHSGIKMQEHEFYSEPVINLIEMPQTRLPAPSAASLPPALPKVSDFIPAIDDPEILGDAEITTGRLLSGAGNGISETGRSNEFSSLPFVPRQILEVIPEKVEGAEGAIKLRLKIGIDGYVKDYVLSANTTSREVCLKNVMAAVMKSRWQPVSIDGGKIEYWIDKTYIFN